MHRMDHRNRCPATAHPFVLAIHGSPRAGGNSHILLEESIRGLEKGGIRVELVRLAELAISPCLELYGCKEHGRCVIDDDFQRLYDLLDQCSALILASPVFFYAVSAHTKILMDRCQSFWVRKHWLQKDEPPLPAPRPGLFLSVAASHGAKLFEGPLLSVRYFFEAINVFPWKQLLYRGFDEAGAVRSRPEILEEAALAGRELAGIIPGQPGAASPATRNGS